MEFQIHSESVRPCARQAVFHARHVVARRYAHREDRCHSFGDRRLDRRFRGGGGRFDLHRPHAAALLPFERRLRSAVELCAGIGEVPYLERVAHAARPVAGFDPQTLPRTAHQGQQVRVKPAYRGGHRGPFPRSGPCRARLAHGCGHRNYAPQPEGRRRPQRMGQHGDDDPPGLRSRACRSHGHHQIGDDGVREIHRRRTARRHLPRQRETGAGAAQDGCRRRDRHRGGTRLERRTLGAALAAYAPYRNDVGVSADPHLQPSVVDGRHVRREAGVHDG